MGRLIGWLGHWVQLHVTLMSDLSRPGAVPPALQPYVAPGWGHAGMQGPHHHPAYADGGAHAFAQLHRRGAELLAELRDASGAADASGAGLRGGVGDAEWEAYLPQLVSLVTTRARSAYIDPPATREPALGAVGDEAQPCFPPVPFPSAARHVARSRRYASPLGERVALELALGFRDAILARCARRPHLGLQTHWLLQDLADGDGGGARHEPADRWREGLLRDTWLAAESGAFEPTASAELRAVTAGARDGAGAFDGGAAGADAPEALRAVRRGYVRDLARFYSLLVDVSARLRKV